MAVQSCPLVVMHARARRCLALIVRALILRRRVLMVFFRLHGRDVEVFNGVVMVTLGFARVFAEVFFCQIFLRFIEIEVCEGYVCRAPLRAW